MKDPAIHAPENGHQIQGKSNGSLKMATKHKKVAIVGAGAAGLACAKELIYEGHTVKLFEEGSHVGGTWVCSKSSASTLHADEEEVVVHSSMYDCLRTNLPRELMSFIDFPFVPECMGGRSVDPRRYPGHEEVRAYLEAYTDAYNLRPMIQLKSKVINVDVVKQVNGTNKEGRQWLVATDKQEEQFDAVVVCNGHYSKPVIPEIDGSEAFPGLQMHSHNYRNPKGLDNKIVVVVGTAASGSDISRDVANIADHVYLSGRSQDNAYAMGSDRVCGLKRNIFKTAEIIKLGSKGEVWFKDGQHIPRADAIIYCTGYNYTFPFLDPALGVTVGKRRVTPLYKQMFVPDYGTELSFVGIPFQIVPFPFFEYQSKYIGKVLAGKIILPSKKEMEEDTKAFMKELLDSGFEIRHTHLMRNSQFGYVEWLAGECGVRGYSPWRKAMFDDGFQRRKFVPEAYRETWSDTDSIAVAHEEFEEGIKKFGGHTHPYTHAKSERPTTCSIPLYPEHIRFNSVACELDG